MRSRGFLLLLAVALSGCASPGSGAVGTLDIAGGPPGLLETASLRLS